MGTHKTFLDTPEAADYLGVQRSTLEAWRCRGGGPNFVKLGRLVKYRQTDLDNFIEARVKTNTQTLSHLTDLRYVIPRPPNGKAKQPKHPKHKEMT